MKRTYIMTHHTASKDCPQGKDLVAIKADHIARGWVDIGYNYGVELVNNKPVVTICRGLNIPGAHCPQGGMNRKAIGVAVVGNFEIAPPSPLLIDKLVELYVWLSKKHDIPTENIVGHKDYKATLCPGKFFPMDYVKDLVEYKRRLTD